MSELCSLTSFVKDNCHFDLVSQIVNGDMVTFNGRGLTENVVKFVTLGHKSFRLKSPSFRINPFQTKKFVRQ